MNIKEQAFRYKFRVQLGKCTREMLDIMKSEIIRQIEILNKKKNHTK